MAEEDTKWPQFDWHAGAKAKKPWRPYSSEHQTQLRNALENGQQHVVLNVDGWEYDVDLTAGQEQQKARHTGFFRKVRVRHEPA